MVVDGTDAGEQAADRVDRWYIDQKHIGDQSIQLSSAMQVHFS